MGHCLWGSTLAGRCLLPGWGLSGNTFKLTWLPVSVIWGKSISLLSEISLRHKLWIWTLPFLFLALGNWPGNSIHLPRSPCTVFAIDTIWAQWEGTAGIIKSGYSIRLCPLRCTLLNWQTGRSYSFNWGTECITGDIQEESWEMRIPDPTALLGRCIHSCVWTSHGAEIFIVSTGSVDIIWSLLV